MFQKTNLIHLILAGLFVLFQLSILFAGETGKIAGSVIDKQTGEPLAGANVIITSVWQGLTTEQIWNGASNAVPQGHWYLSYLSTGDGMQAFGLSIAFFSIILGMVAASIVLFKKRSMVFGIFALIAAAIIAASTFS